MGKRHSTRDSVPVEEITLRLHGKGAVVVLAAAVAAVAVVVSRGIIAAPVALPPEIYRVIPEPESRACRTPEIAVGMRLTDAMRRYGSLDVTLVALKLDGKDITASAQVSGTKDLPQSMATLTYTPAAPLAVGWRQASFTFPSSKGPVTYEWRFRVAEIACR
ncbi:MAG: hypothetical protein QME77_09890 [bacterium]|nr:hypothetical protein [bacterium]